LEAGVGGIRERKKEGQGVTEMKEMKGVKARKELTEARQ
jgi:hypothetical protein